MILYKKYDIIIERDKKMLYEGNWWGINNDWADEINQYPFLKHLFLQGDKNVIIWLNDYIVDNDITTFLNNLENINLSAIISWGGKYGEDIPRRITQPYT